MADVELRGVTKSCGDVIVIPGIDLHIPHESFTVLVGPSGRGKSTVLRMIAGLETVTEGHIRFGGLDVTLKEPKEREIAMLFQSYALYPHMTMA